VVIEVSILLEIHLALDRFTYKIYLMVLFYQCLDKII